MLNLQVVLDTLQEVIVAPESEAASRSATSSWWMFPAFILGVYVFGLITFGRAYGFNPLKWRIGSKN